MVVAFGIAGNALAGDKSWSVKWETAKVFIENKGQFPVANKDRINGAEVLYAFDNGPSVVYFTKKGLVYAFNKKTKAEEEEIEGKKDVDKDKGEDKDGQAITKSDIIPMIWEGANPDVQVVASEPTEDYFSYVTASGKEHRSINGIKAYHTLRYVNLYPNIDVVYVFSNRNGTYENNELEYSIILHPGADVSLIKMKYPEDRRIYKNYAFPRALCISTAFDENIMETSPKTFYQGDSENRIKTWFHVDNNTVSFRMHEYDHSKEVIIDPFVILPSFPNSNKVWEVERDTVGNVYLYGGDMPMTLRKYNAAGTLQWTYFTPWDSSSYWIGTMICDKAGNCYVTSGANGEISKVNTSGSVVWHNNPNGLFGPLFEYWHLAFNCDQTQLVCGGTRTPNALSTASYRGAIMNINLSSGAVLSYVEVGYVGGFLNTQIKEARALCSSPNGNYYYLTLDSIGCVNPALAIQYQVNSTYNFTYGSPAFGVTNQGVNAMRATHDYIYTQNGATLSKRNIATGAILNTVNIPGGNSTSVIIIGGNTPGNMGLDIDSCGNVYVGSTNGVYKYDANLNLLSSATTTSAVYDVAVTGNGEVLACGNGFAASLAMTACNPVKVICSNCPVLNMPASNVTNVTCNGQLNGSFTINTTNGTGPFGYILKDSTGAQIASYSNVAGAQNFTNLGAGTYTLHTTDANGCTGTVTVTITQPPAVTASISGLTSVCSSAHDTLTASAGFTVYHWSNASTSQNIVVNTGGTYTVTVTNAAGCTGTASTTITINAGAHATFTVDSLSGCAPLTCHFTNTSIGASSYLWNFGDGGTSNSTSPAHTYAASGVDTVRLIAYGASGCNDTLVFASITVLGHAATHAAFTVDTLSGCKPLIVHFTNNSTGFTSCLWHFGDNTSSYQTNPLHSYTHTATYTVKLIVYDTTACGIFIDSVSQTYLFTVYIPPVMPILTVHGDTLISSYINGNQWYRNTSTIPGATNQRYVVTGTGCYSVEVTDTNGCTAHSDTTCFTFAGINELPDNNGISIFPNPSNGFFTIKILMHQSDAILIKVTDVIGQIVYASESQSNGSIFTKDIRLEEAADGIYLVQISIGDKTINRKLVLTK